MAVILCFGDSITYGYDPSTGGRSPAQNRWPDVMAERLGPGHTIITEALPGRTTVFDSPYAPARSGRDLLAPLLESHAPLDLVIIMLGTNDLQVPLELSARHSASGLWTLLDIVARSNAGPAAAAPLSLVIVPPAIRESTGFMGVFYAGRDAESLELPGHYATICDAARVPYLVAGDHVEPSVSDGVHLDADAQRVLGVAVADRVAALLA